MEQEIKEQLNRIEALTKISAKEVLNINEVCAYTGLSRSRIYALCNQRVIPHYKQGKIYFKKAELENWLTSHKVASMAEIESEAVAYCLNNKKGGAV